MSAASLQDLARAARERGDLAAARRLIDEAVAADAGPDNLLARAAILSDQGNVLEAIADAGRAVASRPKDAAPLLARAQFHLQRRNYPEALADLDAAAELSPEDPTLRVKRAELYALTNRLADAAAEMAAVSAAFPESEDLRLALLSALVLGGSRAQAQALIARLLKTGSPRAKLEARFARACVAFRFRLPGLGARDFRALFKELPEDDSISMRARFYWTASRPLDPTFRRRTGMKHPKKSPRLYLCGLGMFPPYTASLEVLHAIGRSDVAFNNVAGPEVRSILGEFCGDVRPASYQAWQDEPKWANKIFVEIAKGRTVAFVTRGHPLVFGGLAVELIRRCKAQGIEHHTFGSVSSIDYMLAYAGKGLGDDFGGITAVDFPAFAKAKAHNAQLPLLLCFYAGVSDRAGIKKVRAALERFYPGALACWMFGPKYDVPPAVVRIDQLEEIYPSFHASLMLYVPALAGAAE
jgi:precorrin-3B methylase/Flp pilus assembly protein TadD